MKIIAKRESILGPLQAVIGVVERRQTMPILANVLLSAKGGRLSVTATDLEVGQWTGERDLGIRGGERHGAIDALPAGVHVEGDLVAIDRADRAIEDDVI